MAHPTADPACCCPSLNWRFQYSCPLAPLRRSNTSTPPSVMSAYSSSPHAPPSISPTAWSASIPCAPMQLDDRIASFPLTISSHRHTRAIQHHARIRRRSRRMGPGKNHTLLLFHPLRRVPHPHGILAHRALRLLPLHLSPRSASVVLANRHGRHLATQDGNGAVSGEERFSDMSAYVYGEFSAPVNIKWKASPRESRMTASAQIAGRSSSATASPSSAPIRPKESAHRDSSMGL